MEEFISGMGVDMWKCRRKLMSFCVGPRCGGTWGGVADVCVCR